MIEKECKYQEGVYEVQTFRTTQFLVAILLIWSIFVQAVGALSMAV